MLSILVISKRPLDVTGDLLPMMGLPDTRSRRVSLLHAARSLEQRGLVRLSRSEGERGWGRVLAEANEGANGMLRPRDVQQAKANATG